MLRQMLPHGTHQARDRGLCVCVCVCVCVVLCGNGEEIPVANRLNSPALSRVGKRCWRSSSLGPAERQGSARPPRVVHSDGRSGFGGTHTHTHTQRNRDGAHAGPISKPNSTRSALRFRLRVFFVQSLSLSLSLSE